MYNSGRRGRRANDGYGVISQADKFNQTEYPIPIVTSFAVTDGSYVPLDDTAASTAGGQTIVVYGSGFAPGATIMVGGTTIGSVTYLDQGRLTFTSPANTSGSYTIIVMNANGGTGILVPGLVYSGVPTWSSSAGSVGSVYETTNVNSTFVATGDAPVTYSVLSGSLPPGTSLSATGVLTGSAPVESGSTTYSFTIRATDGELQDSDRSFSLTVNTDVVSWSTPTNNQVISGYEYAPISNVTASATSAAGYGVVYSANSVPTGITVNANTGVISGTVNTTGNTYTRLTATANTTTRTAIRDVVFNINPDVVTWNSPADATQYSVQGGSPISNVSLSASSAAGFGVQYTANALPTGLSISGSVITGTPTTAETVTTLLTATANTSNRSATRTISWSISLGDLNWKNTVLLLSANTPTPSFINDSSNNNLQLTIAGDTRPSNFDPYQEGYYSFYMDGTSTTPITISTASSQLNLSGDFTVELWFYDMGTSKTLQQFMWSSGGITCGINAFDGNSTRKLDWRVGGSAPIYGVTAITPYTWHHAAYVKSGNTFRIYLDGKLEYYNASYTSTFTSTTTYIGGANNADTNYSFSGHISNLRVVNGSVVYSTASTTVGTQVFTPPTTPLTAIANTRMLIGQTNRFSDVSVSALTLTPASTTKVTSAHPFTTPTTVAYNTQYSVYFDGSGDNLTIPSSAATNISSGDFTVEMWFRTSVVTGDISQYLVDSYFNGVNRFMIYSFNNTMYAQWISAGVGKNINTTIAANTWYHLAFVKSGNVYTLYLNGNSVGTPITDANALATGDTVVTIGRSPTGGGPLFGYISNLRFVKGTAVYTSNFTPPTSPLTAISGTSVLTCQDSTIKDNSPNALAITSTADARPVAVSPFTMTTANTTITSLGSGYFDGTGDYLQMPVSTGLQFGTGNFTVECWSYLTTLGSYNGLIDTRTLGGDGISVVIFSNGTIEAGIAGTQGSSFISAGGFVTNQWNHIAFTRSSNSVRLFLNGVSIASGTISTSVQANYGFIGKTQDNWHCTGYISDIRVIKGTALYTSNFVPPQAPLTPVANTQLLTLQYNGGATNNGFVDQSSFNNLITRNGNTTQGTFSPYSQTGWSNYFDGSGDELTLALAVTTALSGTYTIESWCYYTAAPTGTTWDVSSPLLAQTTGTSSTWHVWALTSTGLLLLDRLGNNYQTITSSITMPSVGQWFHVAITNVGTTVKFYLNGQLAGSLTQSAGTWSTSGTSAQLGAVGTRSFTGYLSNFRIVNGTEVYTTTFTPPTSPLLPIANTSLLTCQDNRFIDNSPNNRSVSRFGDVSVQAFSPFGGITSVPKSYSTLFTRSASDYITAPASSAFAFGTGAYTIEAWVYFNTITTYRCIFCVQDTTNGPALVSMTDGSLRLWNGGLTYTNTPTGTVTTGRWYHIAWVRESTSLLKLYVDGTSVISVTSGDVVAYNLTGTPTAYISYFYGFGHQFDGYISNFRITKGQALYTTNFTPSTSPLTTTSQGATAANVSLLTCQSSTMIDNSTNNFAITATNSPKVYNFNPFGQTTTTQVSYTPSVNGGSMYFDGTGDNLSIGTTQLWTPANSFTIEGWFNIATSGDRCIFSKDAGTTSSSRGIVIYVSSNGALNVFYSVSGSSETTASSSAGLVVVGQWYHFAFVKNGSSCVLYLNGVSVATFTAATIACPASPTNYIGMFNAAWPMLGYITDFRIVNGAALYTSNFYPGSAPLTPTTTIGANTYHSNLLVSGTSGGIIDYHGTNNLETVGNTQLAPEDPYSGSYYSNYFDGTGDYLSSPYNAVLDMGTGDCTMECWFYIAASTPTNTDGNREATLFSTIRSDGGALTQDYSLGINGNASTTGTGISFNQRTSGTNYSLTYTATITQGVWHHIAVSRTGNTLNLLYDGVRVAQNTNFTASITTATGGNPLKIGGLVYSAGYPQYLNGNISNVRLIKGTALYTGSTYTVPTSPLTAITNTSLLTCQSNTFKDNSTNAFAITANGDTKVKSFNPFQQNTGKSIYFDGTGDYLTIPVSPPNMTFGSSDFTFETWVYPVSVTSQQSILYLNANTSGYAALALQIQSGALNLWMSSTGSAWSLQQSSIGTIVAGVWTHIAVTKSGTTMKVYINGTQAGTNYTVAQSLMTTYTLNQIGVYNTSSYFLTGYLKDLRITKAVRYTTTFTPPTAPFEVK